MPPRTSTRRARPSGSLGSLGSLGSAFKQSPLSVANKNKTRSRGAAAAARREAREKSEATEQARAAVAATAPVPADAASPPAAAEENAPGALTQERAARPARLRFRRRAQGCFLSPHSWLLSVLGSGARDGAAAKAAAQHAAAAMDASASARDSLDALFAEPLTGGSNKAPTPATVMGGGEMGSVAPATAAAHADAAAMPPPRRSPPPPTTPPPPGWRTPSAAAWLAIVWRAGAASRLKDSARGRRLRARARTPRGG